MTALWVLAGIGVAGYATGAFAYRIGLSLPESVVGRMFVVGFSLWALWMLARYLLASLILIEQLAISQAQQSAIQVGLAPTLVVSVLVGRYRRRHRRPRIARRRRVVAGAGTWDITDPRTGRIVPPVPVPLVVGDEDRPLPTPSRPGGASVQDQSLRIPEPAPEWRSPPA